MTALIPPFLRFFDLCSNSRFFNSFVASGTTPILDKEGNDYSKSRFGLPQGSRVSPVLMNSFLHPLDIELDAMIEQKNGEF